MNYKKTCGKPNGYKILETVKHDRMHLLYLLIIFGAICVSITPSALAVHFIGADTKELTDDIKTAFEKASTFTPTDIHGPEIPEQINCSTITVTNGGLVDSISYCIANATIDSITLTADSYSLLTDITTIDDGWISLKIPKNVLDAVDADNVDDKFLVLRDGEEVVGNLANPELILLDNDKDNFAEIKTTDWARTLTIEFEDGTDKIEIIGNSVIPEFGMFAILVLISAIISVIVLSKRTQLRFSGTY